MKNDRIIALVAGPLIAIGPLARAQQAERVKALVAAMPPQLRDTVLAQIRAGHTIEAARTYARASGEDLTTATEVVDLLAERAR